MKIIPLSEGAFSIDRSKVFVPFNKGIDNLQDRPLGSLLVEVQPFVLVTEKDVLLFDTGLGFTGVDGQLQLHQNLMSHGINPGAVTKVLMSHLHKDHAGGISFTDPKSGQKQISFPNATHYVNGAEFKLATQADTTSYKKDPYEILSQIDQVVFTEGNGNIDSYIRYEVTGAHSPNHQVFWVEEAGETIFFGADVAPQLKQMKHKYIAKYDYDGKKAMELRQSWWEQGEQEHWTFLFYHDIKTPNIRL